MKFFLFFILMLIKVCFSLAAELENDTFKNDLKVLPSSNSFTKEGLPVATQVISDDLCNTIANNCPVVTVEGNRREETPPVQSWGAYCYSFFELIPVNIADVFSPLTPFRSFQSIAGAISSRN